MIDKETLLCENQAVTAAAASTDQYNFGSNYDKAVGQPVYLNVLFTESFNASANVTVKYQTDSDVAFGSPIDAYSVTVANAAAVAGKRIQLAIPYGGEQYGRLYMTPSTTPSTGKITAWLSDHAENWYPTTAN